MLDICPADQPACDGETLATCNPYGGGYVEQTTDCSSTGQVCNMSACVDAAEDTVGSTDSSSLANHQGAANRFYMHTDRTLTEIETYASVSEASDFDWFVYEGTTSSGTYDKIFDSTNTSSGTASFHNSGPIDVALQAGHYYIVGVRIAGTAELFYTPTTARATVSFGQLIWGLTMDLETSPLPATWSGGASSTHYYQQLTTQAP